MAELPHGPEVLVVDRDERVLRGLEKLLGEAGLTVTSQKDPQRALDVVSRKPFAVVVIDADTIEQMNNVSFVGEVKKRSPKTVVLALVAKRTFEAPLVWFRAGVLDVVPKAPDAVGYLRDRVVRATAEMGTDAQRERLLGEASEIHEEFLKRLLAVSREATDLEDRLAGRTGAAPAEGPLSLLLVDARPFAAELAQLVSQRPGFRVILAQSGGEALDMAGRAAFHIVVLGDELPDLPPTMVLRTLRGQSQEVIAILLRPPIPGRPGSAFIVETSRQIPLLETLNTSAEVAAAFDELREAFYAKTRERHYLKVFRDKHMDFLKRYADLRLRIQHLLGREGSDSMASGILRTSNVTPKPKG
jgi:DNA-binding response OmpR family regulator